MDKNGLIMHLEDLEGMSLINAQGEAQFFKGDRIDRIETEDGNIFEEYADPPMYILDHEKAGYGLDVMNPSVPNLLYTYCGHEDTSGAEA